MELRKVNFRLCPEDGYQEGAEKEYNKSAQMQRGYFHCWIPDIYHDPHSDKDVPVMNALVEEESTGILYSIHYSLLEFEPINK